MSDEEKPSIGEVLKKGLNGPGDYAAFFLGTAAGVILDIGSGGVSLGQGTILGGAAALGAKKAYDAGVVKKHLINECKELEVYYKSVGDNSKAEKISELLRKMNIVKSMSSQTIRKEIDLITSK